MKDTGSSGRMKNQAYKIAIKKADTQLRSKLETGDELQYIDFHQLQIENQQFVIRIEEANTELLDLKRRSGRTVKILNNMKKRLNSSRMRSKRGRPCSAKLSMTLRR